ncbi:MAG TPA: 3-carboxyethylcatechol 2,3-dioxygenase [Nakamurella sp.]|jgi:2,3-dihydroxyphenylpropionate 1,2-dioxygenase
MTLALVAMSHSPLLELSQPPAELTADVETAFAAARTFVAEYDPELVVVFGPDHYNGFFYELMPQFCVGLEATSIGDFGCTPGPLDVPRDIAQGLAQAALDGGVDLAVSLRMEVDHGMVQPLEILFGGLDTVPTVPFFINSVAPPFSPINRVRLLGEALGRYLSGLDKRVLLIGSGGLSHEPPVPSLDTAPPAVVEGLIAGRHPTAAARAARQDRVIDAARRFAAGEGNLKELNPEWDQTFLHHLQTNDLDAIDGYSNESILREGGNSAQEVRNWIAAYAALSTAGPYDVTYRYYRPIPEFIAGFGVTTAVPRTTN